MGPDFIVPVIAIVFGTILTGVVFWKIIDLIKAWMNRGKSDMDQESFDRLAKAFIQHRKDTERRLKNLEAIVTDDEPATGRQISQKSSAETIEIEENDAEENKNKRESSSSGRLNNMLNKERNR